MANEYPVIPSPGYWKGNTAEDNELLYSYAGFTQKGVTIAAGQGVLPIGTVLGRKTSDKKYYAYNNSGSGGVDTARGVLRRPVNTGTDPNGPDQQGNLVIQGILKANLVSGADASAITDLGATVDAVRNTFKF